MIYTLYRKVDPNRELGFYTEATRTLTDQELAKLRWLVAETFEPNQTGSTPFFTTNVVEIGPRLSIETPFSSNAVAICQTMGLPIVRLEQTTRYVGDNPTTILETHLDRMTQQRYENGIRSFETGIVPEDVYEVDLLGSGVEALAEINRRLGLGMDAEDMEYYYHLFTKIYGRNPTNVELFQLGNANSEHSRHHCFRGKLIIDGVVMPDTLFEIVQQPLKHLGDNNRSLLFFRDNAGVVGGFEVDLILPITPGKPSEMRLVRKLVHITCTAESHNHPTHICPFQGAATGAGGRERDGSAPGQGGILGVGIAGYFVGSLFIPEYSIPGEVVGEHQPSKYASPLSILLEGSKGISSYGNQFGEPLTCGFTRSFGQIVDGEWREPRKPVLYSAGVGHIFGEHVQKEPPEVGMLITRFGGPAYPIGVGGGSASSMMAGENTDSLDFASVQRGNAEMENRAYRVIRACVEMGENNPIASIHDQGAGGPSNVLTELIEPLGGRISIRDIILGDKTMSVLEIWSAEFQEGWGVLIRASQADLFESICKRERVNCEFLGEIDGSGNIVVKDAQNGTTPVNLSLGDILTNIPQKTFRFDRHEVTLPPLEIPPGLTIGQAIEGTFRLIAVGSKGHLVHKVDRSVTGLVAQQQCVGIAQIPIANVSVNAQSHFDVTGSAAAVGEQPIKMLIDPQAGARMAVAEMLTNMASARITDIGDIRCRANWMWPAKLPHEGPRLYDAAKAMSEFMIGLGIAVDGGKDSLSMASVVGDQTVKAPGTLVVLGYAPMADITKRVTPDIKKPQGSLLMLMDLGLGKNRLGGSALAQILNQIGSDSPDIEVTLLRNAFLAIQQMIDEGVILSLHDRSDGGCVTAVIEMCMASRCGFLLSLPEAKKAFSVLFTEEAGFILEVGPRNKERVHEICDLFEVPISMIGMTLQSRDCAIDSADRGVLFKSTIEKLRMWWESTSFQLQRLQMNSECAQIEYEGHREFLPSVQSPYSYRLTFGPTPTPPTILEALNNPRVAVIREEGTNGDREKSAVFLTAGLAPTDVTMSDLLEERINLDSFQGLVYSGGFSFMDVFGSAKGWAGTILWNEKLREMFDRFYARQDTFSLGVCNGCQLMALLGVVPWKGIESKDQPRFITNTSEWFESRWVQVEILPSPSILLAGMEGSRLGVWVAHGEGRLVYPNPSIGEMVEAQNLAPLRYLDPYGRVTTQYPHNPNGSPLGIAALCSPDGRHLAMMPHPERCFRPSQWSWMPPSWAQFPVAPWLRMFQNARTWCLEQQA